MRRLILVACLALAVLSPTSARATPVSLGPVGAVPELFGIMAGFWVDPLVDLDLRATLSTLDAGVTGHLPVGDAGGYRVDLLLNVMGGWVHGAVHNDGLPYRSARVLAAGGVGLCEVLDLRVLLGVSAAEMSKDGWGARFAGYVFAGYVF